MNSEILKVKLELINKNIEIYKKNAIESIEKEDMIPAISDSKRYSILTDDLEHCIICGRPYVNKHEIFFRDSK